MKDVTSTYFGLVIAFLLPGLAGLYSLAFWSNALNIIFKNFLTAQSNVGLFFMILLASVTIGLIVTVFRWLIYECLFCKSTCLENNDFENLGKYGSKLIAFRAVVDEHYRYHQFWGGITIVLPLFYTGWIKNYYSNLNSTEIIFYSVIFMVVEIALGFAAVVSYKKYVERAKSIINPN